MIEAISNILGAIAAVFGFKKAKLEANNTPAMKANTAARTDAAQADEGGSLVARAMEGDKDAIEQLRREAGE